MVTCKYTCAYCTHAWTTTKPKADSCVKCGHPYVSWVNFAEWHKAPGKSPKWVKADRG